MEEILDNIDNEEFNQRNYEPASNSKRFANYLIDSFGYLVFTLMLGIAYGAYYFMTGSNSLFLLEDESITSTILEWGISMVLIAFYYILNEYFFNGKTLGKWITKTRAVTMDNRKMDFWTIVKRSFARLIPFEQFSFLDEKPYGWHDSLSNTKVIEDKDWG